MAQRRDRSSLVYIQRFNVKAGLPHLEVRSIVFFVGLLVLVGLAGWLYLHQASEVAASVQRIRRLQTDNQLVQEQILALHSGVAILGSLKRVRDLGASQGYQAPQSSDSSSYLVLPYQPDESTAASAAGTAPVSQESTLPDTAKNATSLLQRLIDQLSAWMRSSTQ